MGLTTLHLYQAAVDAARTETASLTTGLTVNKVICVGDVFS
jgi:hypothetical protein